MKHLTGAVKMLWFYRLKTENMLLATGQKHLLCPLVLNINLNISHTEQVYVHQHLKIIIDNELATT